MSLEAKLEENTKALIAMTAALHAVGLNTPAAPAAAAPVTPAAPKAPPKAAAPAAPAPAAPAALDYVRDIKPKALKLAQRDAGGREALMAVLAEVGVASAKDAPADKYPALLAALDKALVA